jgi:ElaB/YqjD/DUF883 family membrane-anchored ribosome-binding protein
MQNLLSPFVGVFQTQLEASRRFADAVFTGTEKLDRVMIDATHHAFNRQLNLAQSMMTAQDPQSAATVLQSNFLSRNPDDAMNYQKEVMRIFAEMQNDFGKTLREYVEHLGINTAANAATPMEAARGHANDALYNPVSSMFSVWESAFKDVAELAKKNMDVARSQVENAASRTMDTTTRFTTAASDSAQEAVTAASMAGRSAMATGGGNGAGDRRGTQVGSGRRK